MIAIKLRPIIATDETKDRKNNRGESEIQLATAQSGWNVGRFVDR
jgi:hypothetical protein